MCLRALVLSSFIQIARLSLSLIVKAKQVGKDRRQPGKQLVLDGCSVEI